MNRKKRCAKQTYGKGFLSGVGVKTDSSRSTMGTNVNQNRQQSVQCRTNGSSCVQNLRRRSRYTIRMKRCGWQLGTRSRLIIPGNQEADIGEQGIQALPGHIELRGNLRFGLNPKVHVLDPKNRKRVLRVMVKTIGVYGTQGIPPNTYSAGTMKEENSSLSRGESQAWEQKHGVRKKFKASLGYRVQPCLKKEKK